MFLDKHSRFFRRYELVFSPRNAHAATLDLISSKSNDPSIEHALRMHLRSKKAFEEQSNKDIVELMDVVVKTDHNVVVLLFHRASPGAADPTYRRKLAEKITLRQATKELGEEQAVSAHMFINMTPVSKGRYRVILEEIPGMGMGVLRPLIGHALANYEYGYEDRRKQSGNTYSVVKAEGIKSESIEGALKGGHFNSITLVRPARADFVDAEGMFAPINEKMKINIVGQVPKDTWSKKFGELFSNAKKEGWEEFNIEVDLPEKRKRTIKMEREQEASEVLFIRSEHVNIAAELIPCSLQVVDAVVKAAVSLFHKDDG